MLPIGNESELWRLIDGNLWRDVVRRKGVGGLEIGNGGCGEYKDLKGIMSA